MRPSLHARDYQVAKTAKSVLPTQSTWDNELLKFQQNYLLRTGYEYTHMNAFRKTHIKASAFFLSIQIHPKISSSKRPEP
jgi:hypothetical protein